MTSSRWRFRFTFQRHGQLSSCSVILNYRRRHPDLNYTDLSRRPAAVFVIYFQHVDTLDIFRSILVRLIKGSFT